MSMTESEAIEWLAEDTSPMLIHIAELKKENPMGYINEAVKVACNGLEEVQQYRAIGTVSEFRELKEKATAKKIKGERFKEAICPCCLTELYETYWAFGGIHYCTTCGSCIDWSEGKE